MPDRRRHRGPDPEDATAFAAAALPALCAAVEDMRWLLDRGYAPVSSLKLVGDRHALTRRQRDAASRSICATATAIARRSRLVTPSDLRGRPLAIDGFNVLTTLEVALSGGVVLVASDGTLRDIAGMHGTYRLVEETRPAIERLGGYLTGLGVGPGVFLFDRPVSNSGRIAALVRELATERGWPFTARVVDDPDRELVCVEDGTVVASADGAVIDRCGAWCNLARECVAATVPEAWVVGCA